MEALCAQLIGEGHNVRLEMPGCVGRNVLGPGVRCITALIHSDRSIAGCAERGQNLAPTVGEFRPPMQEEDALPVPRPHDESRMGMRPIDERQRLQGRKGCGGCEVGHRRDLHEVGARIASIAIA
jgi:hypothetical protein